MKNLRYLWIAVLCLMLIGCSRETVNSDINSDTNSTVETAEDTDIADEAEQANDLTAESDTENPAPEEEVDFGDEKTLHNEDDEEDEEEVKEITYKA